jgi:hypothetical protein
MHRVMDGARKVAATAQDKRAWRATPAASRSLSDFGNLGVTGAGPHHVADAFAEQ